MVETVYEKAELHDFEMKILASGRCESFIPMSFVSIDGKIKAAYHAEGYQELQINLLKNPYTILDVIEKMVLCIKDAQNHLIRHTSYSLKASSIYLNLEMSAVKIKKIELAFKE